MLQNGLILALDTAYSRVINMSFCDIDLPINTSTEFLAAHLLCPGGVARGKGHSVSDFSIVIDGL